MNNNKDIILEKDASGKKKSALPGICIFPEGKGEEKKLEGWTLAAYAEKLAEEGISMNAEGLAGWMRQRGYLRSRVTSSWNTPTDIAYAMGLLHLVRVTAYTGGNGITTETIPLITEKGAAYFLSLLREGRHE